jgi:hypothetical protein
VIRRPADSHRSFVATRLARVVAVVLAGLAAACGGAPRHAAEPSLPATSGREVFLAQCQGCHSLNRLGPRRPSGGDLAGYSMSPADVASYARVMPTPRPMTPHELALVSRFVSDGQRHRGGGQPSGAD